VRRTVEGAGEKKEMDDSKARRTNTSAGRIENGGGIEETWEHPGDVRKGLVLDT